MSCSIWHLIFRIRNAGSEQSRRNWGNGRPAVGWTVLPVIAMILFIMGFGEFYKQRRN